MVMEVDPLSSGCEFESAGKMTISIGGTVVGSMYTQTI